MKKNFFKIIALATLVTINTSLIFNNIKKETKAESNIEEIKKDFVANPGILNSIEVLYPIKDNYIEGEKIDISNLTVIANGNRGQAIIPTTSCTITPNTETPLTTNDTEIKITYLNLSTTININVYPKIESQNPTNIDSWLYKFNENINLLNRPTNNINIDFIMQNAEDSNYYRIGKNLSITNTYIMTHPTTNSGIYLYSQNGTQNTTIYITNFSKYYENDPILKNNIINWFKNNGTFIKKLINPNDITTLNNQIWNLDPGKILQINSFAKLNAEFNFISNNENFTKLTYNIDEFNPNIIKYWNNENEFIKIFDKTYKTFYTEGTWQENRESYKAIEITNFDTKITNEETRFFTLLAMQIVGNFQLNYEITETEVILPNPQEPINPPSTSQEVIDLPGLMLHILSMPWYFISTAFDVTLFPDTNYRINFSNIFKGLIAILTLLFIVKLFTNGFNAIGNIASKTEDYKNTKADTRLKNAKATKIEKQNKDKK